MTAKLPRENAVLVVQPAKSFASVPKISPRSVKSLAISKTMSEDTIKAPKNPTCWSIDRYETPAATRSLIGNLRPNIITP